MLCALYAMSLDCMVDLETVAKLCNQQGLRTAVVCTQRCLLPSRRLPLPCWEPQYHGTNVNVQTFFETSKPEYTLDAATAGGYVDCLLMNGDEEALRCATRA